MKALVAGGGGFLGRRIVALLRARGDEVRILARRAYPEVEALGVTGVQADVCDTEAVARAVAGVDVVFHAAAKIGPSGSRDAFWKTNVEGTRILLDAARRSSVRRFVFTSTPSVVGYERDIENGGPELPYALRHESAYAETKAAGERLVLAQDGAGMATVSLRPHLVVGPGDRVLMPRVVRSAARLRIVGDGSNRVDFTYVDNAAWAHLDAADALDSDAAPCAGRAYFISNGEPVRMWSWVNEVLAALDQPPVTRSWSLRTARRIGRTLEILWKVLPLRGEPPLTPFLVGAMGRSHWFDMGPAMRDLGYRVRVPMDEATRRTVAWLRAEGFSGGVSR